MTSTTLLLLGEPNTEPSFLATVEPVTTFQQSPNFTLPIELVLDSYTRENWSLAAALGKIVGSSDVGHNQQQQQQQQPQQHALGNNHYWQYGYLVSTDGKKRLSGFVHYLQERKKAAVANFQAVVDDDASPHPASNSRSTSSSRCGKAILVVPYDPPPMPPELVLPKGVHRNEVLFVMYLRDENLLKSANDAHIISQELQLHQPKNLLLTQPKVIMQSEKHHPRPQSQQNNLTSHPSQKQKIEENVLCGQHTQPIIKTGCLGKLLGAQRRTESHLGMVRTTKKAHSNNLTFDPNTGAAGCINQFRSKILKELQRFHSDPTAYTTSFPLSHASLIKNVPLEEQDKVTFNVFKFAIYEQVDEVGMGQWIAVKEPSEFLDECIITVYKNGHCPADVLDEMNRGDLPDEVKGQARYIVESQSKGVLRKGKKIDDQMIKDAIVGEDNVVVLNTNKRDRRTLEQIQNDLLEESDDIKKGRFDP